MKKYISHKTNIKWYLKIIIIFFFAVCIRQNTSFILICSAPPFPWTSNILSTSWPLLMDLYRGRVVTRRFKRDLQPTLWNEWCNSIQKPTAGLMFINQIIKFKNNTDNILRCNEVNFHASLECKRFWVRFQILRFFSWNINGTS